MDQRKRFKTRFFKNYVLKGLSYLPINSAEPYPTAHWKESSIESINFDRNYWHDLQWGTQSSRKWYTTEWPSHLLDGCDDVNRREEQNHVKWTKHGFMDIVKQHWEIHRLCIGTSLVLVWRCVVIEIATHFHIESFFPHSVCHIRFSHFAFITAITSYQIFCLLSVNIVVWLKRGSLQEEYVRLLEVGPHSRKTFLVINQKRRSIHL